MGERRESGEHVAGRGNSIQRPGGDQVAPSTYPNSLTGVRTGVRNPGRAGRGQMRWVLARHGYPKENEELWNDLGQQNDSVRFVF